MRWTWTPMNSLPAARTAARILFAVAAVVLGSALLAAQSASPPANSLAIGGDVPKPFTVKAADRKAMPRTTVKLAGTVRTTSYEGVLLGELLKQAGAPLSREPSGDALTTYVLASASDGYQVLFS